MEGFNTSGEKKVGCIPEIGENVGASISSFQGKNVVLRSRMGCAAIG
jgi:hypothetical protein